MDIYHTFLFTCNFIMYFQVGVICTLSKLFSLADNLDTNGWKKQIYFFYIMHLKLQHEMKLLFLCVFI